MKHIKDHPYIILISGKGLFNQTVAYYQTETAALHNFNSLLHTINFSKIDYMYLKQTDPSYETYTRTLKILKFH